MASQLANLQRRFRQVFGDDAFAWFDRSYVVDWTVATAAWFVAWLISELPPYERDFHRSDPTIDFKHRHNQISGSLNWTVSLFVPLAVAGAIGCFRRSALEIHHSSLALYAARGTTSITTEFLKNRVGRLRPDFLSRCDWDKEIKACTGKVETVLDGRRSFPSGHSSTAFTGMTFLSLYLAGMTGAWCLSEPARARSLLASRTARLALSLAPLVFATWVAISRVEDYRHHIEDVIVGGLIGAISATVCYLIYWPNPFAPYAVRTVRAPRAPRARMVYTDDADPRDRYDYELAGMEHANGAPLADAV
ncbi:phosphatidic acid phosphatase type 2/haloperoxidase [Sparassis latifolia]